MTDHDLLTKRLTRIETCVDQLRRLARPERLADDIREQSFVERRLQVAIQAALQAGAHVIADERLGEPTTQRQIFELDVDLAIVRDIVEHQLGDLLDFVAAIRARI